MQEQDIGISYSDYYLPSTYVTTSDYFSSLPDFSLPSGFDDMDSYCATYEKQKRITGIYVEQERQEIEVFEGLLDKFFENSLVKPEDIDIIIYTKGVRLHEKNVNVPYYVQKKYGLTNAIVFNVDQTCGASLMSIHIAELMIRSSRYRSALILSSSFIDNIEDRDVRLTLISDGAGILFVDKQPLLMKIKDFFSRTTGSYSFSIDSFTKRENYKELVKYLQNGARTMQELLHRNALDFDSIKLVSPQNTTYSGWEIYASLLKVGINKIFLENIPKGAHMGDVDTIRNITDITAGNLLSPKELIIAYGLGWGTSWNACLLEMQEHNWT